MIGRARSSAWRSNAAPSIGPNYLIKSHFNKECHLVVSPCTRRLKRGGYGLHASSIRFHILKPVLARPEHDPATEFQMSIRALKVPVVEHGMIRSFIRRTATRACGSTFLLFHAYHRLTPLSILDRHTISYRALISPQRTSATPIPWLRGDTANLSR